jgi:hypothetical protein
MLKWAHGQGMDMTVIETMPMGEIDEDRTDQYMPLSLLRSNLAKQFTLEDIPFRTGGPARYVTGQGDGRQARLHHPDDPQFLRKLQPRAPDLHRHALHVPRPGTMPRICALRCARRKAMNCCPPPSTKPSAASPRGMTSSSTGPQSSRQSRAT